MNRFEIDAERLGMIDEDAVSMTYQQLAVSVDSILPTRAVQLMDVIVINFSMGLYFIKDRESGRRGFEIAVPKAVSDVEKLAMAHETIKKIPKPKISPNTTGDWS